MSELKLKINAKSNAGVVRSNNEDFYGIIEKENLVIVCDGMGGHKAGAYASQLAVKTVSEMYASLETKVLYKITKDLIRKELSVASPLIGSIRLTNRMLYNQSIEKLELQGMGTTISTLAINQGHAIIGHVGDSRIYRFREGKMELLTEDHTWLNELILDNEIDTDQAKNFKDKNVITRALGLNRTVKIDLRIEPLNQGDIFLLCTDGLTKALSENEIKRIVLFNEKKFNHTLNHLIDDANIKDGSDNITIAMVAVEKFSPIKNMSLATKLTLKAEDNRTARIENRILKRNSSSSSLTNQLKKLFS